MMLDYLVPTTKLPNAFSYFIHIHSFPMFLATLLHLVLKLCTPLTKCEFVRVLM